MPTRGRGRGKRVRSSGTSQINRLEPPSSSTRQLHDESPQDTHFDSAPDVEESNTQPHQQIRDVESNSSQVGAQEDTQRSRVSNNGNLIQPCYDSFIPDIVSRRVMDILRRYMPGCATWELVPSDYKEYLFQKFKERYSWLPEHDSGIRHSWEQTHTRNYKQVIYRFKQNAIKQAGGEDLEKMREFVPKNMSAADWNKIVDYMSEPNYKEKSEKARQNRMTEVDGSITRHTGGSISHMEHGRRLAADNPTVKITPVQIHDRTHRKQKGKGEYCDPRSKKVKENYEARSQDDSNPTPEGSFDPVKWIEASGGPSKGRVYSFGNTIHYRDIVGANSSQSNSISSSYTAINEEQMRLIEEKLTKEREEAAIREAKIMEEAKKIAEEARQREEVLSATLAKCLDRLNTLEAANFGQTSNK